jgi:hypothetical protein
VHVTRTVSASVLRSRARCAPSRSSSTVASGRTSCLQDPPRHGETYVPSADEADMHEDPLAQDLVD